MLLAAAAEARNPELLHESTGAKIRKAAKAKEKVSITDVNLGHAALDTLELEPMELWAPGAKLMVQGNGGVQALSPPDAQYFRGRVKGDPSSAVFLAVADKKIHGMVVAGGKHFALGSATRVDKTNGAADDDTIGLRELEAGEEPSSGDWTCDVESQAIGALRAKSNALKPRDARGDAGTVANAQYQFKLEIDTDFELFSSFNSVPALTTYIESLVGNASVVFQRDLGTTLTIGNLWIYTTIIDPWSTEPLMGSAAGLGELSRVWHETPTRANKDRSAVVMVSGRTFSAGRAFTGTMCGTDTHCGIAGEHCGGLSFANAWSGAYAFCGTNGSSNTTIPDPTATRNGITYAMPNTNDYWMLFLFLHEVGHLASAPHTNCVWLSMAEQQQWNVSRFFIDECLSGESKCYSGTATLPTELGTIMSNCNNLFDASGNRGSRYAFWEPNRPSSKMYALMRTGLDSSTPDGRIRLGSYTDPLQEDPQPLTCTSHTAKVAACTGCDYEWSITGGTINGNSTKDDVTYTPTAPIVTLTVTVTRNGSCGITVMRQVVTACATLSAPASFSATANGSAAVALSWNAVTDATHYEVARTSDGTTWTTVGNALGTSFLDINVTPGTVYLYRVRGLDASLFPGAWSTRDFAATYEFTDAVIAPHATPVRAMHIIELRAAVNALRALSGLPATTFTDPSLTNMRIKRLHIVELRDSLAEAVGAVGRAAATYTDPVLNPASTVRSAHVDELRAALR